MRTNIDGRGEHRARHPGAPLPVETVVGISTDKACKPVNVMGMTKAIQERIFIAGEHALPGDAVRLRALRQRARLARLGDPAVPSTRSRNGGPVTITTAEMTRFLLSLDQAVDTVFAARARRRSAGETYVPRAPSARVVDIADALIGDRDDRRSKITGIRPGEKMHEIMVSRGGGVPHGRARQLLRHPADAAGRLARRRRAAEPCTANTARHAT